MSKFHVGADGQARPCRATKRPCKYAQEGQEHYDTAEEAEAAYNAARAASDTPLTKDDNGGGPPRPPVKTAVGAAAPDPGDDSHHNGKKIVAQEAFENKDGSVDVVTRYNDGTVMLVTDEVEYHFEGDGDKGWSRTDGPAVIYKDSSGLKQWMIDGKIHREDGPAMEWSNGRKEYWNNGRINRDDGPAVISADGEKEYWLNGHKLEGREEAEMMDALGQLKQIDEDWKNGRYDEPDDEERADWGYPTTYRPSRPQSYPEGYTPPTPEDEYLDDRATQLYRIEALKNGTFGQPSTFVDPWSESKVEEPPF